MFSITCGKMHVGTWSSVLWVDCRPILLMLLRTCWHWGALIKACLRGEHGFLVTPQTVPMLLVHIQSLDSCELTHGSTASICCHSACWRSHSGIPGTSGENRPMCSGYRMAVINMARVHHKYTIRFIANFKVNVCLCNWWKLWGTTHPGQSAFPKGSAGSGLLAGQICSRTRALR